MAVFFSLMPRAILPILLGLGLCVSLAPSARAQETTTIQYRWAIGDVIRQRVTMDKTSKITGGILDGTETSQKMVWLTRMTVAEIAADGAATMRCTMESVKMDSTRPGGGKSSFDSTKPPAGADAADPTAALMRAMLGEPFTTVMGPDGSPREIRDFEKIEAKLMRALEALLGGEMVAPMLKKTLTPTMKQFAGSCNYIIPPKPVKPGEAWDCEREMSMPGLGSTTTVAHSVFKGLEEQDSVRAAKIDSTLTQTNDPTKNQEAGLPPPPTIKDSATSSETWFDIVKGRLKKSVIRTSMTMDMPSVPGAGAKPMQAATTMVMTLEDASDEPK